MNILIIGNSGCGKTTAANILARLTGGKVANESDYIIRDYAKHKNLDPQYVFDNKPTLRDELYKFAREKQAEDPAYPVGLGIADGANIVTGTRNPDELVAKRHLYDLVLWIYRPGFLPGSTDKLSIDYADRSITNDGTIEDLEAKLKELVNLFEEETSSEEEDWGYPF